MEWVEASGKSLAEAREAAADMLGVAEDDAEFVTVSEPKAGLFGRIRGEARVRARVRPVTPPPKRGRRQRSDRGREGGSSGPRSGGNGDTRTGGPRRSGRNGKAAVGAGDEPGGGEASTGASGEPEQAGGPDTGGERPGPARRRRSRAAGSSNGVRSRVQEKQGSGTTSGESEETMEESLTLEEQGQAAQKFLTGLVREFGLEATVTFSPVDDETVQVAAVGDDLGLLVGPRGATLSAVQDLTRTFVQRQSENRTDRILVDVGGYREKRTAALRRFVEGIVEEVKETGEERALEPMSPADRKVIHDTVNDIEGVETRSSGEEPARFVVIAPV